MKKIRPTAADRRFGVVLIIISAASFGVIPIFARLAYNAGAEPITVLFLRFSIAAVVMNLIMVSRRTAYPRGLVLLELILLGAIAYVGESLAYSWRYTYIVRCRVAGNKRQMERKVKTR